MTLSLILGLALFVAVLIIVVLIHLNYALWLEREEARRRAAHYEREAERIQELALVERMAGENLRLAVRRREWGAAERIVEAWDELP